jgi:hypothetical protein
MKKVFVILSVVSALIFSSCDNENSVNPQPLGKATISGTVYAEFDYTNNSPETTLNTVANKKLLVEIYDYVTDESRFIESTTDASGNYSIKIEIGNHRSEVNVDLVDFKQDVKYAEGTESVTFYGNYFYMEDGWVEIVKGGEYIRDIYYND